MGSPNTIKAHGSEYILDIKLIRTTSVKSFSEISEEHSTTLPISNMLKLELVNDLIDPIMYGSLEYNDTKESYLNGYLSSNGNYLYIGLNKFKDDSTQSNDSVFEFDFEYDHLFLIDSIDIVGRTNDNVSYLIKFKSVNWFNFHNSQPHSTYTKSNEPPYITDIIRDMYVKNQLQLGETIKTFTNSDTNKTHYITTAGQTLKSSSKSLLNLLNQIPDIKEYGLLTMVYDHMSNEYDLWMSSKVRDGMDAKKGMSDSVKITISQNGLSTISEDDQTKIWLKNYIGQTSILSSLRNWTQWVYDYDTDSFSNVDHTQEQIMDSLNNTDDIDLTNSLKPFSQFILPSVDNTIRQYSYERSSEYYNNMYDKISAPLLSNNVVIVNTTGNFERNPGNSLLLSVDLDKDAVSPLQYLIGWWTTLRVRHIFTTESYMNNIMIGRFNEVRNIDIIKGG